MSDSKTSKKKETFGSTLIFVFIICLVCAALVSISAVSLKPLQQANKLLDKQTFVVIIDYLINCCLFCLIEFGSFKLFFEKLDFEVYLI